MHFIIIITDIDFKSPIPRDMVTSQQDHTVMDLSMLLIINADITNEVKAYILK